VINVYPLIIANKKCSAIHKKACEIIAGFFILLLPGIRPKKL